jgi:hypothetical protein
MNDVIRTGSFSKTHCFHRALEDDTPTEYEYLRPDPPKRSCGSCRKALSRYNCDDRCHACIRLENHARLKLPTRLDKPLLKGTGY